MYERYIQEYKEYSARYGPLTAVFLMVGSFYELYDVSSPDTGEPQTSMRRAVDIMGIQLKIKKGDAPGGCDGMFAGFPESQLHKFAALLTREQWTVVVIDQVKDGAGRVAKREVARILSPGTHVEAVAGGSDAVFLGGLWLEVPAWTAESAAFTPPRFAAVAFDLSTGALTTFEGRATGKRDHWSADELLHFFAVHPPRELLVWWRGHAIDQPTEAYMRRILGLQRALVHVRQATPQEQKELERESVREELLRRCFRPQSLLSLRQHLGLVERPCTERAIATLLLFVEDHFRGAMERLHSPVAWNPGSAVVIGNHALTQLNMITAREDDSVLALFQKTVTPLGHRAIRERLLYPITDAAELEHRYEEIAWWLAAELPVQEKIVTALRQIADIARLHRRISVAAVTAADILILYQSYRAIQTLQSVLEIGTPLAAGAAVGAQALAAYMAALEAKFDIEKARSASEDAFCLTETAGPVCAGIEKKLAESHEAIRDIHAALAEWLGEAQESLHLEIKDSLIQISAAKGLITRATGKLQGAAAGASVPTALRGIQIHARKTGGSFEIPALNQHFHAISRLREQLAAAIREELPPVCDGLAASFSELWDGLEKGVARIDVTGCLARVARERGFCRPRLSALSTGGRVVAKGMRHPLIEQQQSRVAYVKHDVQLGATADETGWLIYGMNASGKSSLMKSVGIAVLLAQCGSFVPAASFELAPFRAIYTRILNTDNLWAGLSSFAVEMTELREILVRADEYSLVLGDEVCSGTESVSATALVGATLEWFARKGVRYMFATHLHGLQEIESLAAISSLKTWHLRVRYDHVEDCLVYERTLHPGPGNSLYGLEVAKAMAIPLEILERAHSIRRELLGTRTEMDAAPSEWNSALQRRVCEMCGHAIARDLEVHHIRPRKEASEHGTFEDGRSMNTVDNLVVVCQKCHDAHHAGEMAIGPLEQTSHGPRRVVNGDVAPHQASFHRAGGGLSDEKKEIVLEYLRKYPTCPASRLKVDLEQKEGIKISVQRLGTLRSSL